MSAQPPTGPGAPAPRRTDLALVVAGVRPLAGDVRQLTLAARGGGRLPSYPPGSHLGLRWGPDRVNSYSLTGDGQDPAAYTLSVLRAPDSRGGSAWAHALRPGDPVDAVAPRSAFPVAARARRHLLVAGGIGITPLLSHARWHVRWGADFVLYYCHRRGRGAHLAELRALCGGQRGGRLHVCAGRDELWAALGPALARQPLGTQLYVCGPPSMTGAVTAEARRLHWAQSRIRSEAFAASADGPRAPFLATLAADGRRVAVSAGETLLEALERAGVPVPSLCRGGVCGECRTPVAAGRVDHRDLVLSAAERESGDWIMPCVSRAAGDEVELSL